MNEKQGCLKRLAFLFSIFSLFNKNYYLLFMGRGDKKTAKGKRFKGSFGKTRLAKSKKTVQTASKTENTKATPAKTKLKK